MEHRTCRSSRSLIDPVDNPEKIAWGEIAEKSIVPAQYLADEDRLPRRVENTRYVENEMTELLQKERIDYDRRRVRSSSQKRSKARTDAVIPSRKVHSIVEVLLQESIEKLDY